LTQGIVTSQERVFDAVLERRVPWRRLAGSTLCAAALLGILLGAVISGARHAVVEGKIHIDPVVTFLDLPSPAKAEAEPDDRSLPPGGAVGAPTDQLSNATAITKIHTNQRLQKPERNAALTDRAKETVADEAPRDQVAQPAPIAQGGGRANEGPMKNAGTAPASGGSPDALGNGAGGGGGAGGGNGEGTGVGAGAGVQTGAAAAGRFGVLPFGDGMTRPTLLTRVDPTYTHEAMDGKVGGVALVKCVLTVDGTVRDCRIVKGLPFMNEAIISAVSRWKYSPVIYQGRPAAVEYLITLHLSPP
jgi:protein TonB